MYIRTRIHVCCLCLCVDKPEWRDHHQSTEAQSGISILGKRLKSFVSRRSDDDRPKHREQTGMTSATGGNRYMYIGLCVMSKCVVCLRGKCNEVKETAEFS